MPGTSLEPYVSPVVQTPRRLRTFLPAVLAVALSVAACDGGDDAAERRAALEQQRLQLLNQFAAAQNEVRNTQSDALEHPEVQPLRDEFYDLLRARMIEIDPGAGPLLDRARELGAEIDELSRPVLLAPGEEPAPTEVRRETLEEFRDLEQRLRPIQNRAMADSSVAAAMLALQDSVHATMVRLNPDAAGALERMRSAAAAVDSIDARIAGLVRD